MDATCSARRRPATPPGPSVPGPRGTCARGSRTARADRLRAARSAAGAAVADGAPSSSRPAPSLLSMAPLRLSDCRRRPAQRNKARVHHRSTPEKNAYSLQADNDPVERAADLAIYQMREAWSRAASCAADACAAPRQVPFKAANPSRSSPPPNHHWKLLNLASLDAVFQSKGFAGSGSRKLPSARFVPLSISSQTGGTRSSQSCNNTESGVAARITWRTMLGPAASNARTLQYGRRSRSGAAAPGTRRAASGSFLVSCRAPRTGASYRRPFCGWCSVVLQQGRRRVLPLIRGVLMQMCAATEPSARRDGHKPARLVLASVLQAASHKAAESACPLRPDRARARRM